MVDKPKIVVLCGSSRFVDIMAVCAWLIERDENAITMGLHLLPQWYAKDIPDHLAEHEGVAEAMDERHLRKIDEADEIFVVNFQDYIGDSTTKEIYYTKKKSKKIRWYTHDPIGEKVDEIIAQPLHHILSRKKATSIMRKARRGNGNNEKTLVEAGGVELPADTTGHAWQGIQSR